MKQRSSHCLNVVSIFLLALTACDAIAAQQAPSTVWLTDLPRDQSIAPRVRPTNTRPIAPATQSPTPTSEPSITPQSVPENVIPIDLVPTPTPSSPARAKTEFGIQIDGCTHDPARSVPMAKSLGFTWIKQQVRWGDMQQRPGHIDWSCIDRVIVATQRAGIHVLLSITTAPAYMRHLTRDTLGLPDDVAQFGYFVDALMRRYRGQVQALELWNEPHLAAESSDGINPMRYAVLAAIGAGVAKRIDSSIMIISAALAPVEFESIWTHVSDTSFLADAMEFGLLEHVDCIGAHANGPPGVGDLDRVASRYYSLTLQTRPICATEVGLPLAVRGRAPRGFEWAMGITQGEQTQTLLASLKWARSSGYVRLVIIWNLDVYSSLGPDDFNAPYALWREGDGWQSTALPVIQDWLNTAH